MRYITGEREDSTEMEEEEEEQNNNWFSKWEEQLPPPDKLTPLSQTLITPDLALAFNISSSTSTTTNFNNHYHHLLHQQRSTPPDFDSFLADPGGGTSSGGGGVGGGGGTGSGGEEPARTLKRPRLVWTPQLHKRFVDAVAHLGIKNAVPKTIMQLMSVDGLTRENVASHLQKYRLYLKRMQGVNNGAGGGRGGRHGGSSGDSATDRLFASSPVPPHFLHQGGGGGIGGNGVIRASSDQLFPYGPPVAMTVAAIHHHQQQMAGVGVAAMTLHHHAGIHHQVSHRQTGHFGSTQNGDGGRFQSRSKMGAGGGEIVEDLGSESTVVNGRKVLTLFPTADD